jgi:hypothetical protein
MSLRYVPIPPSLNELTSDMPLNITYLPNASIKFQNISQHISMPVLYPVISNEFVEYLLLAIALSLIFFTVILYIRNIYRESTEVLVNIGEKNVYEAIPSAEYIYTGLKKILRRYFIALRDRAKCVGCTPREVLHKLKQYHRFVEVYEDVVYGDKQRSDVEEAINEVKSSEG